MKKTKTKKIEQDPNQLDFFGFFAKALDAIKEKFEKKEVAPPKKLIDLSKYNLVYKRKTDGRKFLVRAITKMDYSVIDTVTAQEEKLTQAKLRARMKPFKEVNKRNRERPQRLTFGKRRAS